MHGSVSWKKENDNRIKVIYGNKNPIKEITELEQVDFIENIISELGNNFNFENLNRKLTDISKDLELQLNEFYEEYIKLAIINPNKWKFHDTVFEQHYYQLIRNFSYELEKENTILFVFAFSFADEHILEIFKRALSNPQLEVIIIAFNKKAKDSLKSKIGNYTNISYYPLDEEYENSIYGDFSYFNGLLEGETNE